MHSDILYPTDGSDGAMAAMERVRELAEETGATVHLLYVVDTAEPALGIGGDPQESSASGMVGTAEGEVGATTGVRKRVERVQQTEQVSAEQFLEKIAREFPTVDTETAVRGGDPHQAILDYAEKNGTDLIIMGTHGRTGLNRYLLGSVTEKVVRLADQPVMTVGSNSK